MKPLKSSRVRSVLLALALFIFLGKIPIPAYAQQAPPPDCLRTFTFVGDGSGTQTTTALDNRFNGCQTWTLVYAATGSGSLTNITFQSAPGAITAGSWGSYAGTVTTGINPNTSSTGAATKFSNGTVTIPWVRVLFTEGSFVGTVNGVFYGYKTGYAGSGSGGGGSGCVPSGAAGQVLIDDGAGACSSSSGVTVSGGTTVKAVSGYSSGGTPPTLNLGTGGGFAQAEGTIPSACKLAGVDCLYSDSTQHGFLASVNNGNYLPIPQGPASSTSGNGACWNATNGGLLSDCGGVPVPATRTISTTSPLGGGGDLSANRTLTCTTCTTNGSALTANLPVIGAGSNAVAVGTRSGNTTQYVTTTGAQTNGRCVEIDSNGNHIAAAAACGTGGTGCTTSGSANGVLVDNGAGGCTTSGVTIDPTAGKAGAINMPQGTACTPAANSVCRYAPTSIGTAYGIAEPSSVGVTGIVHSTVSGAVRTDVAPSLIVNADITNATIDLPSKVTGALPTANMAAASLVRTCIISAGDPGAASPVLADDNDSPNFCKNKTGVTMTITSVSCYADAGSPTVTPIITGGGSTSILSGALTCSQTAGGAAGTLNGTPTLTSNTTIDGNITTAGGTAKYIVITIGMTL